jgi:hypothetical protein
LIEAFSLQFVNDIFEEFAAYFVGAKVGDDEIVHPGRLDRSQLDYSVTSLKAVDNYLTYLHENHPQEMGKEWVKTALRGGAYVGEVIRHNARRQYDWVDFDDFIREYPNTTRFLGEQKGLGFRALLTPGGGGFTLPINKILRFIQDGPADSVWYYASCEVREKHD